MAPQRLVTSWLLGLRAPEGSGSCAVACASHSVGRMRPLTIANPVGFVHERMHGLPRADLRLVVWVGRVQRGLAVNLDACGVC